MSVEETGSLELFEGKQQEITRQELVERVSEHVNRILRRNLYELKLDEKQTFRLLRQKEELRRYLKEAGTGNLQVKEYLISFIQEFLLNGMKMDEEMIKHTFFFSEKGSRQAAVRFDILLFLYKEQYGSGAMEKLIEERTEITDTEFSELSRLMQDENQVISAHELAKDGCISQVYPFEENKEAIGLDMLKDPERAFEQEDLCLL